MHRTPFPSLPKALIVLALMAPVPALAADDEAETAEKEEIVTEEAAATPEDGEEFKARMHEGDVALGVCGARVSALMWFYEASAMTGREDLKASAENLKNAREVIKAEAERRATEDGVDTSVRVMNSHSEELWKALNEKADGDAEAFQKTHDELAKGVQECLALFFPQEAQPATDEKEEG